MGVDTTRLYRGFTQTELDRAYSPSAMVADIEPFLQRYADDSAAVRAQHRRWSTHLYGPAPTQTLDLFMPTETPAPLLVFIHGGYWQALSMSDASFPAAQLTAVGLAYAALNYTLAPHATMDEIVGECRAALTWLWSNRDRLDIATSGIVISGHSAGAHLAAMMLTTDWAARGIDPAFIRAGILLGGVYDLEPIRQSYVNDAVGMDEATSQRNSPLFATPTVRCPLVVAWAERDTDEFKRQSAELAEAWRGAMPEVVTFEQAGVNHFDSLFDWCDAGTRLFQETVSVTAPTF